MIFPCYNKKNFRLISFHTRRVTRKILTNNEGRMTLKKKFFFPLFEVKRDTVYSVTKYRLSKPHHTGQMHHADHKFFYISIYYT